MLFFSAVDTKALELLRRLNDQPDLNGFYLVGGTALALYYGHRISIDHGFFTDMEFDTNILLY